MTFDIGLHEVCVRVGEWAGGRFWRADVRYVITKLSLMDSLPNFLTHGAPLRALSKFVVVMFFVYTINK